MSIKQQVFSQHLRDAALERTILDEEKIYSCLLRANLREVLANIYPRLSQQLGVKKWTFFLDQFLQRHAATTPYFYQVPDEFLSFLWHNKDLYREWPWVFALAHFEWMELVATVADVVLPEPDVAMVQCSPVAYGCQYDYAVFPLEEDYAALAPRVRPWQGIVYRNRQHQVHWLVLDQWSSELFALIQQKVKSSVDDLVIERMKCAPHYSQQEVTTSVVAWCDEWKKLDILI